MRYSEEQQKDLASKFINLLKDKTAHKAAKELNCTAESLKRWANTYFPKPKKTRAARKSKMIEIPLPQPTVRAVDKKVTAIVFQGDPDSVGKMLKNAFKEME